MTDDHGSWDPLTVAKVVEALKADRRDLVYCRWVCPGALRRTIMAGP